MEGESSGVVIRPVYEGLRVDDNSNISVEQYSGEAIEGSPEQGFAMRSLIFSNFASRLSADLCVVYTTEVLFSLTDVTDSRGSLDEFKNSIVSWLDLIRDDHDCNSASRLQSILWEPRSLIFKELIKGTTLALQVEKTHLQTRQYSELLTEVMRDVETVKTVLDASEALNLADLDNEHISEILASGLSISDSSLNDLIRRPIVTEDMRLGDELASATASEPNSAVAVMMMRRRGMINYLRCQHMLGSNILASLIVRMVVHCGQLLQSRVANYAASHHCASSKQTLNCIVFSFSVEGVAKLNLVDESYKEFCFCDVGSDYNFDVYMKLSSIGKTLSGKQLVFLEVVSEVRLTIPEISKVLSYCRRSPGRLEAPEDLVMKLQDCMWDVILQFDAFDRIGVDDDFEIANCCDMTPLMVLAGIKPASMSSDLTKEMWKVAIEKLLSDVCDCKMLFSNPLDRKRFFESYRVCAALSMGKDSIENERSKLICFFTWGLINDDMPQTSDPSTSRASSDNHLGKEPWLKVSGVSAMTLWLYASITPSEHFCKLGYRYLPLVILYNYLNIGVCKIKLNSMAIWLISILNMFVDRVAEDAELFNVLGDIGVSYNNRDVNEMAVSDNVSHKLMVTMKLMNDHLQSVSLMTRLKTLERVEILGILKFLTARVAGSESLNDRADEDDQSEADSIPAKIIERIRESTAVAGMMEDDALAFIEDLAKCLDDVNNDAVMASNLSAEATSILNRLLAIKRTNLVAVGRSSTTMSIISDDYISELSKRSITEALNRSKKLTFLTNVIAGGNFSNNVTLRDVQTLINSTSSVFADSIRCDADTVMQVATVGTELGNVIGTTISASLNGVETVTLSLAQNLPSQVGNRRTKTARGIGLSILSGLDLSVVASVDVDFKAMSSSWLAMMSSSSETRRLRLIAMERHEGEQEMYDELVDMRDSRMPADLATGFSWSLSKFARTFRQRVRIEFNVIKMSVGDVMNNDRFTLQGYKLDGTRFITAVLIGPFVSIEIVLSIIERFVDVVWDTLSDLWTMIREVGSGSGVGDVDVTSDFRRAILNSVQMITLGSLSAAALAYKSTMASSFAVMRLLVNFPKTAMYVMGNAIRRYIDSFYSRTEFIYRSLDLFETQMDAKESNAKNLYIDSLEASEKRECLFVMKGKTWLDDEGVERPSGVDRFNLKLAAVAAKTMLSYKRAKNAVAKVMSELVFNMSQSRALLKIASLFVSVGAIAGLVSEKFRDYVNKTVIRAKCACHYMKSLRRKADDVTVIVDDDIGVEATGAEGSSDADRGNEQLLSTQSEVPATTDVADTTNNDVGACGKLIRLRCAAVSIKAGACGKKKTNRQSTRGVKSVRLGQSDANPRVAISNEDDHVGVISMLNDKAIVKTGLVRNVIARIVEIIVKLSHYPLKFFRAILSVVRRAVSKMFKIVRSCKRNEKRGATPRSGEQHTVVDILDDESSSQASEYDSAGADSIRRESDNLSEASMTRLRSLVEFGPTNGADSSSEALTSQYCSGNDIVRMSIVSAEGRTVEPLTPEAASSSDIDNITLRQCLGELPKISSLIDGVIDGLMSLFLRKLKAAIGQEKRHIDKTMSGAETIMCKIASEHAENEETSGCYYEDLKSLLYKNIGVEMPTQASSSDDWCCGDTKLELLSLNRVVIHGRSNNSTYEMFSHNVIDVVDVSPFSFIWLSSKKQLRLADFKNRLKKSIDFVGSRSYNVLGFDEVATTIDKDTAIVGYYSYISDTSSNSEMLIGPAHIVMLGSFGKTIVPADSLIVLAQTACTNGLAVACSEAAGLVGEIGGESAEGPSGCILAEYVISCTSPYYYLVVTNKSDWRGQSGKPVVNARGDLVGICMMQIVVNDSVEVFTGSSLIVCSTEYTGEKLMVAIQDPIFMRCNNCLPMVTTVPEIVEEEMGKKTPVAVLKLDDKRGSPQKAQWWSIARKLFRQNSDKRKRTIDAASCGALEDVCALTSARSKVLEPIDIVAIASFIDSSTNRLRELGRQNSLSYHVLSKLRDCIVYSKQTILAFVSNSAFLMCCCLLSAMKINFWRADNLGSLFNENIEVNKGIMLTVCAVEDIITNTLDAQRLKVNDLSTADAYIYCRGDDDSRAMALYAAKLVGLHRESCKVVIYDSSQVYCCAVDTPNEGRSVWSNTKRYNLFQNSGLLTAFELRGIASTEIAVSYGDLYREAQIVEIVVLCLSWSLKMSEIIKRRTAALFDTHVSRVSICHYSALSTDGTWELIRSARYLVFCSGTRADVNKSRVYNVVGDLEICTVETELFMQSVYLAVFLSSCNLDMLSVNLAYFIRDVSNTSRVVGSALVKLHRNDKVSDTEWRARDLLARLDGSFCRGSLLEPTNKLKEDAFKSLACEGGQTVVCLKDTDVLNEVVASNTKLVSLLCRIKRTSLKIRNNLRALQVEAVIYANNKFAEFKRWIKRRSAPVTKLFERFKKWCKSKYATSVSSKQTSGYYDMDRNDQSSLRSLLSQGCDAVSAGVLSCNAISLLPQAPMLDKFVLGVSAWLGCDLVLSVLPSYLRTTTKAAYRIMTLGLWVYEAAGLFSGNVREIAIGGISFATNSVVNKETWALCVGAVSSVMPMVYASHTCPSIVVMRSVPTGVLISSSWNIDERLTTICFDISRLLLNCCQLVKGLIFRSKLSEAMLSLWKSAKQRTESSSKMVTGKLAAVPCTKLIKASSTILCGAAAMAVLISKFQRDAEVGVATISVLSDRKHTVDAINIYMTDRALFNRLSRLLLLAAGCYNYYSSLLPFRIIGTSSVLLVVLEYLLQTKDELGVYYGLANAMTRIVSSDNLQAGVFNALASWWYDSSYTAITYNSIMITSKPRRKRFNERLLRKGLHFELFNEQNKEKKANMLLTQRSSDAMTDYFAAKSLYQSTISIDAVEESELFRKSWDVDVSESDKLLNLTCAALKVNDTSAMNREEKDIISSLGELLSNQCRYLGRSKKIGMYESLEDIQYSDTQKSVLAISDSIWDGVVSASDTQDYEPAGDSRAAVLMAIAERNDVKPNFEISKMVMKKAIKVADYILSKLTLNTVELDICIGRIDWRLIITNVNEKSTSGIIARKRTGHKLTAAFLAYGASRCNAAKEMIMNGNVPEELSIINVFAKRRIEKKKLSKMTNIKCVITRTIQANEVEAKVANMEMFCVLDKMIKMTRVDHGIAIGINFFFEFCKDDLKCCLTSNLIAGTDRLYRVSLDHSSFDSSQRNWAICLCHEMRIYLIERQMDKYKAIYAKKMLKKLYEQLAIRMMITSHGDLVGVTGQQMSGHATTSSDNSLKSRIYAGVCALDLKTSRNVSVPEHSIRVQGDDTKFDVIVPSDSNVSIEEIMIKINASMGSLGQNVKQESISIKQMDKPCEFLSHWRESVFIKMKNDRTSKRWWLLKDIPIRKREDIFAMLAVSLKRGNKRKTKSDFNLLAAKAMSFLVMYCGDPIVSIYCSLVIWACFSLQSRAFKISGKSDISSSKLPWILQQTGIYGDFDVDIDKALRMHGIGNGDTSVEAYAIKNNVENKNLLKRVVSLVMNLSRNILGGSVCLKGELLDYLKGTILAKVNTNEETSMITIRIDVIKRILNDMQKKVQLTIKDDKIGYQPYLEFKHKIMNKRKELGECKVDKILYIDPSRVRLAHKVMEAMTKRCRNNGNRLKSVCKSLTSDGVCLEMSEGELMIDEINRVAITTNKLVRMSITCSPWNKYNLIDWVELRTIYFEVEDIVDMLYHMEGMVVVDLIDLINGRSNFEKLMEDAELLDKSAISRLNVLCHNSELYSNDMIDVVVLGEVNNFDIDAIVSWLECNRKSH